MIDPLFVLRTQEKAEKSAKRDLPFHTIKIQEDTFQLILFDDSNRFRRKLYCFSLTIRISKAQYLLLFIPESRIGKWVIVTAV